VGGLHADADGGAPEPPDGDAVAEEHPGLAALELGHGHLCWLIGADCNKKSFECFLFFFIFESFFDIFVFVFRAV
jgi:hypothetical protein